MGLVSGKMCTHGTSTCKVKGGPFVGFTSSYFGIIITRQDIMFDLSCPLGASRYPSKEGHVSLRVKFLASDPLHQLLPSLTWDSKKNSAKKKLPKLDIKKIGNY